MSPNGHPTGTWVRSRRADYTAGRIPAERIAQLEALPGWTWSALNAMWWEGVAAVATYAAANGHARVPFDYVSPDGHPTGSWVCSRRGDHAAGRLTAERIAQLEALPGWEWDAFDALWRDGVAAVQAHAALCGHARVPYGYVSPNGHRTGKWVNNRRTDYVHNKLTPARIAELEAIPGWVWRRNREKRTATTAS